MPGIVGGGDSSYVFPAEPEAGGGHFYNYAAESDGGTGGSSSSEDEAGGHHITDFGIGTLVLAMTLGAASRIYLTKVTG